MTNHPKSPIKQAGEVQTEPQLTEAQIADIEARLNVVYAKWHDPGFTKRLLDRDIPALIRDWRAMKAENVRLQNQYEAAVSDFAAEINSVREQLARIANFASHTDECEWWDAIPRTICTCGLADIVEKIK